MDREAEFRKIDAIYLQEHGKSHSHKEQKKVDGVPFFDIDGEYELLAVYYGVFHTIIAITQIVRVISKKHIKGCGSEYAMFKIYGSPQKGFDVTHQHADEKETARLGIDALTFIHWHSNRKLRELEFHTRQYGRDGTVLVPPQLIEFKEGEASEKKLKRFMQALTDIGADEIEAELTNTKDLFG